MVESFKDFSIKKVIMIDDSFISEDSFIEEIPQEVIISSTFNDELEYYIEEEDGKKTLKDFFESEEISIEEREFFFNNINNFYDYFHKTLEGVDIKKYLPRDFTSEILDEVNNVEDSVLFVVDKKLSDRNYTRVLKEVLEKITDLITKKNNCYLFIYTSEVEDFSNYDELKSFLSDQIELSNAAIENISLHINFVEKSSNLLDSVIETAIRKSQKANYMYSFKTVQENTMNSMSKRIWDINNNELLIHYNYLMEGQHLDEILFEIYQSKFSREYENFFKENSDASLNPLRQTIHSYISKIPKMKNYAISARIIKELNKLFERTNDLSFIQQSNDISFGDIIRIRNKHYLVCSQQCDITIRADGKRAIENISLLEVEKNIQNVNAELICETIENILRFGIKDKDKIEIRKSLIETEEFKSIVNDEQILREIYSYFEEADYNFKNDIIRSSYEFFDYKKRANYVAIPSFILDALLISQNNQTLITDKSINEAQYIRYSTKIAIKNEFDKFKNKIGNVVLKGANNEVLRELLMQELDIDFIINDSKLSGLCIKNFSRIGRVNSETARVIFQEYLNNATRPAINEAPIIN